MKNLLQKLFTFFQKPIPQVKGKARKTKGQSLVEVAIAFPFMIMLLGGVIEFGFMINFYLSLLDATRFAARQSAAFDPFDPVKTAADPTWFYSQTAGAVMADLNPKLLNPLYVGRQIILDPAKDDVIVSVYSVEADGTTIRYPIAGEYHVFGTANAGTAFSVTKIRDQHLLISGAPKEGILIVEIVYYYHQFLSLPWMTLFGNPIPMRSYTIFPLIAAEPN